MGVLQLWGTAAAAGVGLLLVDRLVRRRRLPRMPLRLSLLALLFWAVVGSLRLGLLPGTYRLWLGLSDDLLLLYAGIRLLLWLGLELPGALGWWRTPPKLLLQLVTLAAAGVATVVLVRQTTQMDLLGLVTTSAVLTAVIGLASQEALKDLFAGLELQLGEEFGVGDWIYLQDGTNGVVVSITWRDTWLRSIDDALLVVPNSKITSEVLSNRGTFGWASDRFEVGLDYDYPPARAKALLLAVARQHPRVLEEPPPRIRVREFAESSITYEVQVWQRQKSLRATLDLRSDLLEQIWYALHRDGQSIPFPVREVQPRRSAARAAASVLPSPQECGRFLTQQELFADLSPEQTRRLVEVSPMVTYGPGESIVTEGAEGRSMYLMLRGRVEVLKQVAANQTVRVRELGPGDVFGEMTLFLDAPRSATVRAQEECLLLRVGRDAVRALLKESPAMLESLAALVSARTAELENLSREQRQAQTNALLDTMRRLFLAFTGV